MSRASSILSKIDEATLAGSDVSRYVPTIRNVLVQWVQYAQQQSYDPRLPFTTVGLVKTLNQEFERHGIAFKAAPVRDSQTMKHLFTQGDATHSGQITIYVKQKISPAIVQQQMALNMRNLMAMINHEQVHTQQYSRARAMGVPSYRSMPSETGDIFKSNNPYIARTDEIMAYAVDAAGRLKMGDMRGAIQIIYSYQQLPRETYNRFLKNFTMAASQNGLDMRTVNQAIRQARRY